ncbi:MAG: winged helix-turn-helix domain-containing protein [Bacteroidales bacterium]|nr:winged helix-turn-helix domain-containing protein [Bacteroidales bacterium]
MNKTMIGENAGVVWRLLSTCSDGMEKEELQSRSGLSERELYAAVGWLAREDKIVIEQADGSGDRFRLPAYNIYY